MRAPQATRRSSWSLLSHHGMVLREIATANYVTIRELSDAIGITERQVSRIVRDLEEAHMIAVHRVGRRNRYSVLGTARFRHPRLANVPLHSVLRLLSPNAERARPARSA